MSKSKARFLAELLSSDGKVIKAKSEASTIIVGDLPTIPNSKLANSSITINSSATSLGGSVTLTTANVAENTNLYYTDVRADARIVNAGSANWNTAYTVANAALPKAGGTLTGNLSLGDNDKATFGAGDDLQIYHDGTTSVIAETGTGDLRLQGSNIDFKSAAGETVAYFQADGASILYHDGSDKLATTSTGIDVTGIAKVSSHLQMSGNLDVVGQIGAYDNPNLLVGSNDSTSLRLCVQECWQYYASDHVLSRQRQHPQWRPYGGKYHCACNKRTFLFSYLYGSIVCRWSWCY